MSSVIQDPDKLTGARAVHTGFTVLSHTKQLQVQHQCCTGRPGPAAGHGVCVEDMHPHMPMARS